QVAGEALDEPPWLIEIDAHLLLLDRVRQLMQHDLLENTRAAVAGALDARQIEQVRAPQWQGVAVVVILPEAEQIARHRLHRGAVGIDVHARLARRQIDAEEAR